MEANKATEILKQVTPADVLRSYRGRPGCACGCRGTYRTTEENRAEAGKDRGYEVDDNEVNPNHVKGVLKEVQEAAARDPYVDDIDKHPSTKPGWNVANDLYYVTATVSPKRVCTVYLTAAARERLRAL